MYELHEATCMQNVCMFHTETSSYPSTELYTILPAPLTPSLWSFPTVSLIHFLSSISASGNEIYRSVVSASTLLFYCSFQYTITCGKSWVSIAMEPSIHVNRCSTGPHSVFLSVTGVLLGPQPTVCSCIT